MMSEPINARTSGEATASLALPAVTSTKYQMLAELGRGGMATAYLAAMQGPGGFSKLVVIKRLHPAHAEEPEFLRMFLEEARLAARIEHPNVVHTMEVASDGEGYFIAMEYIDGQPLELLARRARATKEPNGGFPLGLQLSILSQVLAGLHFAHELTDFDGRPLSLVHRDVSPHNVMVTYEGHVKIVDFGIAKATTSIGDTSTGVIKGKAQYMPLEQFEGKSIDRRADVFAVGVMLWQALTGRRLWSGLSDAEIYRRLLSGDVPSPRSVSADVPAELDGICMRALAQMKEDRYTTAYDFQCALEAFVAARPELRAAPRDLGTFVGQHFAESRTKLRAVIEDRLGTSVRVPAMPESSPPPPPKRRPFGVAVGVGVAIVLVATGVLAAISLQHARTPTAHAALARVQLTVRAQPAEARVWFDDAPLDGNPATGTFARDLGTHRVRAEASGFVTRTEAVTLDSALVNVDLTLEPEATTVVPKAARDDVAPSAVSPAPARVIHRASPRRAAPAPAPAPAEAPSAAASAPAAPEIAVAPPPATPKRRQVAIDKTNPFAEAP